MKTNLLTLMGIVFIFFSSLILIPIVLPRLLIRIGRAPVIDRNKSMTIVKTVESKSPIKATLRHQA